jgi:hypothetical protein
MAEINKFIWEVGQSKKYLCYTSIVYISNSSQTSNPLKTFDVKRNFRGARQSERETRKATPYRDEAYNLYRCTNRAHNAFALRCLDSEDQVTEARMQTWFSCFSLWHEETHHSIE